MKKKIDLNKVVCINLRLDSESIERILLSYGISSELINKLNEITYDRTWIYLGETPVTIANRYKDGIFFHSNDEIYLTKKDMKFVEKMAPNKTPKKVKSEIRTVKVRVSEELVNFDNLIWN